MCSSKFINQAIQIHYLVFVDHNAWQHTSPEVYIKGLKKCCIAIAVDGADDDMLQYGSEEDGYVRSECEEDKYINCEDGDSDTD
jgi:hypothetical protein